MRNGCSSRIAQTAECTCHDARWVKEAEIVLGPTRCFSLRPSPIVHCQSTPDEWSSVGWGFHVGCSLLCWSSTYVRLGTVMCIMRLEKR